MHVVHACRQDAAQCGVPLISVKVNIKKIVTRLRQYARGHSAAEGILLNPQNVAGMHKAAHLVKMQRTNGAYAGAGSTHQHCKLCFCCSLQQAEESLRLKLCTTYCCR